MNDIVVSICCLAYKAEKYIQQTLDGFLMQKCNFDYEIIIHDDASPDRTAAIIKEYEEKYPNIIRGIYQKENQYSKGTRISHTFLYPLVRGKYIALCEGDDFWTDPYKLQKQVDALERNPDCKMSVHRVKGVFEDGSPVGLFYPNFELMTGVIPGGKFIDYNCTNEYVFQTSSYMVLACEQIKFHSDRPRFAEVSATGDLATMLYYATIGDIYYLSDEMSCYRHGSTSSQARKNMTTPNEEKIQEHYNKQIRMMQEFDTYTLGRYHKLCERKINGYLYDKALRNHEYRELLKPQYRFYKKNWGIKRKIKLILLAIFHNDKARSI